MTIYTELLWFFDVATAVLAADTGRRGIGH